MEAMSLLGLVSEVVGIVDLLADGYTVSSNRKSIWTFRTNRYRGTRILPLSEFLHDAKRFILKNRQIANDAPLQLYCSGLIFAPRTGNNP